LDTFQAFLSFCHIFSTFFKTLQLARQAWIWTFGLEDTQVTTELREDERHRKILEVLTQHGEGLQCCGDHRKIIKPPSTGNHWR